MRLKRTNHIADDSGSDCKRKRGVLLKKQFKGIDCFHAYEHGALFYDFKTKKLRNLISSKKDKWYFKSIDIIRDYTKRTPGSFF